MPNGDRGQAGAEAEAEGGAIGYVAENGHMDARTWRVDKLWTAASGATRYLTSGLLSSGTWRHSCEYALLLATIISLLCFSNLFIYVCRISRGEHRMSLLRIRTRRRRSGQLGPPDLTSECLS